VTSPPSTGSICGPPPDRVHVRHRATADPGDQGTRLKGRWGRDGVQAHRVRPKPGGGPSTHLTWSHWSAPAPRSRTASSSNDPTNREVRPKPRDTPMSRCRDVWKFLRFHKLWLPLPARCRGRGPWT
jgi:hypothetical protein